MDSVDAKKEDTKQDLKDDFKKWIKDPKNKNFDEKSDDLKNKFDSLLRNSIEQVRVSTGTNELTENEIKSIIDYIIIETYKDEKIKHIKSTTNIKSLNIVSGELLGIQYAEAICPTTTNPTYKQVTIDIDGGDYGGYTFEGSNDLYLVTYSMNNSTCEKTYTLYWYDEDHPYLDSLYDGIRQSWYGRIYDIETFTIKNNNTIEFDNAWSSTNDYDCLSWNIAGCHSTTTKSYSGGTVYVANTWNHMMDTSDTNTSLSKVSVP